MHSRRDPLALQAVVLAAGRGTRLRPVTDFVSKGMAPVLNRPVLAWILDDLFAIGIRDFIIVIADNEDEIPAYFAPAGPYQQAAPAPIRVRTVVQHTQRGSGDALRYAAPLIERDFLLCACDNLVGVPTLSRLLARWQRQPETDGLLALLDVPLEKVSASAAVVLDGEWVTHIVEKPKPEEAPSQTISIALYFFKQHLLQFLDEMVLSERGEFEMQQPMLSLLAAGGKIAGVKIASRMSLTTTADLCEINRFYLDWSANVMRTPSIANVTIHPPVWIPESAIIEEKVTIGPNVVLGEEVFVRQGVTIQNAVVWPKVTIPANAVVEGTVVMPEVGAS